jgi:hypothetical protein
MTRFVAAELAKDHWFDISAARRDLGYAPRDQHGGGHRCRAGPVTGQAASGAGARCRTASKSVMRAAMATFSESAWPAIGILTGRSEFLSQKSLRPYCSLPMMIASGPRKSESE